MFITHKHNIFVVIFFVVVFVSGLFTVFTMCKDFVFWMYICMFVHFYRKIMLLCFLFNVYSCVCNCIKYSRCLSAIFYNFFIILFCLNKIMTVKFSFLLFTAMLKARNSSTAISAS